MGPRLDPKDTGGSCEGNKQMFIAEPPIHLRRGFFVVDVLDVASCQILALEKEEAAGERYLCGLSSEEEWCPRLPSHS